MSRAAGTERATRVLLIEDKAAKALHLEALLEEEGLRVTWSADGVAGFLLAQALIPDLVVLGQFLPGMNGIEVFRSLNKNQATADIPIIRYSRQHDAEMIELGLLDRAIYVIPEDSLSKSVLLETVRQNRPIG